MYCRLAPPVDVPMFLLTGLIQRPDPQRLIPQLLDHEPPHHPLRPIVAHTASLSNRCIRSGIRSPACSARLHPFLRGRSLINPHRYFLACSIPLTSQDQKNAAAVLARIWLDHGRRRAWLCRPGELALLQIPRESRSPGPLWGQGFFPQVSGASWAGYTCRESRGPIIVATAGAGDSHRCPSSTLDVA